MAEQKLTKRWLEKADNDYQFAVESLEKELDYYPQICFHFHQSAEKYLKAYIVNFDLDFKKIHDLTELLRICSENNSQLNRLKESVQYLNQFYIETRYPVHWPLNYDLQTVQKAKEMADKLKMMIRQELT